MTTDQERIATLETELATLRARMDEVAPVPPPPPRQVVTYERKVDPLAAPVAYSVNVHPIEDLKILPGQRINDSPAQHEWRCDVRASGALEVFRNGVPVADGRLCNGKVEAPLPASVIGALEAAITLRDAHAAVEAIGGVSSALVPWRDVPLFWLNGRGALTYEQRLEALAEYRRTGGSHAVVLADPATLDGSIGAERALTHAGPEVDAIDWTGFPA